MRNDVTDDRGRQRVLDRAAGVWTAASRYVAVLLLLIGLFIYFSASPDELPDHANIENLLTSVSILWVVSMGMTFVVLTAGIEPVHRAFGPTVTRSGCPNQGGRVVAGLGDLVGQLPAGAEGVQRLQHRGDPEVVVVLADRSGAGLLEVGEAGGDLPVVQQRRDALGVQLVEARSRSDRRRSRRRPTPCRTGRSRRGGCCRPAAWATTRSRPDPAAAAARSPHGPDEGVDMFDHGQPPLGCGRRWCRTLSAQLLGHRHGARVKRP